MPSTVPGLLLTQAGEVKTIKLTLQNEQQGCTLSDIQKALKKKTTPLALGSYSWKNQTLHLFGYKDGKAGTENQHELPPPCDKELYFGDILLLLSKEKKSYSKPLAMKTEEYESFYTQMFEGFESLENSEDDETQEDEGEFEEEEEEDEGAKDEGEFEENEEFSDENEDQETPEEFEGNPKVEEDEEEPIQVIRKKAPKSKSKGKGKDPTGQAIFGGTELSKEETVPTSSPSERHRANIYGIITKSLKQNFTGQQAIELEHHIYNMSLQAASKKHIPKSWSVPMYVEVYTSLARTVIGNLNPNTYIQNKSLFQRVQEGNVTLEEVAAFGFSDLYPQIWKDLSIRQFEREKRQLEGNKAMATDQFECKRCHKRECTYYELQTRSADEPMTIFIQCVNCGKHWRQ